jgi:hypothetical protein
MEKEKQYSCLTGSILLKKKYRLKFLNVEINLTDFFFPDVTHPVGNVRYELLTKLQ